jgi:hypothetical protein
VQDREQAQAQAQAQGPVPVPVLVLVREPVREPEKEQAPGMATAKPQEAPRDRSEERGQARVREREQVPVLRPFRRRPVWCLASAWASWRRPCLRRLRRPPWRRPRSTRQRKEGHSGEDSSSRASSKSDRAAMIVDQA